MSTNDSVDIRYFVFSRTQYNTQKEISRKLGKNFVPNKVFLKGQAFEFTEILKDPNKSRYSDVKVIGFGDIKKMKYTLNT